MGSSLPSAITSSGVPTSAGAGVACGALPHAERKSARIANNVTKLKIFFFIGNLFRFSIYDLRFTNLQITNFDLRTYSYANTSRIVNLAALRAGRMDATTESTNTNPNQITYPIKV